MASWSESDFRPAKLIGLLADEGVDFVIVGGVAVVAHASPRFTKDLDICYATDEENLEALGAMLVDLGATLRGIDVDLPFTPDARTLRQTQILCLTTPHGGLDLLVNPLGCPPYNRLRERAEVVEIAGVQARIASLDDMLSMKRAAGRPQDRLDVESLEIAKRRRGRPRRRSK